MKIPGCLTPWNFYNKGGLISYENSRVSGLKTSADLLAGGIAGSAVLGRQNRSPQKKVRKRCRLTSENEVASILHTSKGKNGSGKPLDSAEIV